MPGAELNKMSLEDVPDAWVLPRGIELRSGQGPHGKLLAFRNPRTREATGVMASALDVTKPLPSWLVKRIGSLASP